MNADFSCDDLQIIIDQGDFKSLKKMISTMSPNTRRNLQTVIMANSDIVPDDLKREINKYI